MLNSNSLFLDSEYKADCEKKINYFNNFLGKHLNTDSKEITDNEFISTLIDGIVNETGYSYADDNTYVYPVRKITSSYSKIIIDFTPPVSQ